MSTPDSTSARAPMYYCMACPLTFPDAETANAHHYATGYDQTWRGEVAPATPPSDPSELPSQTELGVGVAGEIPGVEDEPNDYVEEIERVSKLLVDFDGEAAFSSVSEHLADLLARFAALRLRAEAAEQKAFDAELLGRQATMYATQASYWRNEYAALADANRAAAQKAERE